MQILQDTGCYADMTLPSTPDQSQISVINSIYECGKPFDQPAPHATGRRVTVGRNHWKLPIIVTGPLVFNWKSRMNGLPLPKTMMVL